MQRKDDPLYSVIMTLTGTLKFQVSLVIFLELCCCTALQMLATMLATQPLRIFNVAFPLIFTLFLCLLVWSVVQS